MNETWVFWALAGVLALGVGAVLARSLRRVGPDATRPDLAIYRDQLAEVERDAARGLLAPDEAARLRLEVSRRLLEADRLSQESASSGPKAPALVLVLLAVIGATATYWQLGAPGYPDMALSDRIAQANAQAKDRPSQAQAEADLPPWSDPQMDAETADLMQQLRRAVADRPDDPQGLQFLVRYEGELGNFRAAAAAQTRLVSLLGDKAGPGEHLALADLLIRAANGYVSPEAEAALQAVLTADPENGLARYYSGLLLAQVGRPDLAFRLWERLLQDSDPDAPWLRPLRANLPTVAEQAGVAFEPPTNPTTLPGPTAQDVQAAAEMSAQEQRDFVASMVQGLEDRLRGQGGSAEEWARLIRAYGVLDRPDKQATTLADAERLFAGDDAALTLLRQAAE